MKKKILYFFVITFILLSPIAYWFWNWWGVNIFKFPSMERLAYIYSQDRTLLITTSINMGLYIFAIIRIFFIKHNEKDEKKVDEIGQTIQNVQAPENHFIQNVPINPEIHNDNHWKNMYDNPERLTPKPEAVNQNQNVQAQPIATTPNPVNNQSFAVPQETPVTFNAPPVMENQATAEPQPQMPAQPQTEAQENNVIDMNPVTADDIFRNQIHSVLTDIGYYNFGSQNIEGYEISFVSIAESDTLIIGIINSRYGDIIANETTTDPSFAPSWFTNENKYNSPVWEVKNVANAVEKMIKEVLPEDSEIDIKPVVVIPNANVSNYDDIKPKWDELGVSVVKFLNGTSLPNLNEIIPDKKGTEVLKSYKTFIETLMKYFSKKAKKNPIRKIG